jgi:hypothetical protein
MQLIPLDNSPNQSFTITLSVDGSTLTLKFAINFSSMAGYWLMRIWDASGNLLLSSVPLLTGEWPAANILAQYGYLRLGSAFLISNGSLADYPDSTNLGSEFQLWWGDTA